MRTVITYQLQLYMIILMPMRMVIIYMYIYMIILMPMRMVIIFQSSWILILGSRCMSLTSLKGKSNVYLKLKLLKFKIESLIHFIRLVAKMILKVVFELTKTCKLFLTKILLNNYFPKIVP